MRKFPPPLLHLPLILTSISGVRVPCRPRCHDRYHRATYHILILQDFYGLHMGRVRLHVVQRRLNTYMGESERHLGTQADPAGRVGYFLFWECTCGRSYKYRHVNCRKGCAGSWWRRSVDVGQHLHLGFILYEVSLHLPGYYAFMLTLIGIARNITDLLA
jgi:hypothetical protein